MKKTEDTKSKILEAALDIFSDKGFQGATTRMIANRAEVNEVTVFRHFNSKEELFNEVFDEVKRVGFCSDDFMREDLSPGDAIRFLMVELINQLIDRPKIVKLILYGHLDHVDHFQVAFEQENNLRLEQFLERKITEYLKEQKKAPKTDVKYLILAIMSQVFGLVAGHTLFKNRVIQDNQMQDFINHLFSIYFG